MEVYINFGLLGILFSFLCLAMAWPGWISRPSWLSEKEFRLLSFLPAVALIQPNGSLVELVSGELPPGRAFLVLDMGAASAACSVIA